MEVRTEPSNEETTLLNTTDKIIKHKTGLLNLAEELGNVSKACQVMGMSRDTFYRYKSAVEDGGVEALFERTRRKPNLAIPWAGRTLKMPERPGGSGDRGRGDQIRHGLPGLRSGPNLERTTQAGRLCITVRRAVDLAAA